MVDIILWLIVIILTGLTIAGFPLLISFLTKRLPPAVPSPITPPSCSVTSKPNNVDLSKPVTGGVINVPAFTLPANVVYTLQQDLTIITDDDLIIDGTIEINSTRPVNITLVSLKGTVTISGGALVGTIFNSTQPGLADGAAGTDNALYAKAYGAQGKHAGYIRIIAQKGSIDIQGTVGAYGGSGGGTATANGQSALRGLVGGSASAVGAGGGAGGDILLCSYEAINIDGTVEAGTSGKGGDADATAVNGSDAYAEGGPAGTGGNIYVHGLDPNCQVFIQGQLLAGGGDDGGWAWAYGGTNNDDGGDAEAVGGKGNKGGTVTFKNCVVATLGANSQVDARLGGEGGNAVSFGGNGMPALLFKGYSGGAARSRGGDGGAPGNTPKIPMTTGVINGGLSQGLGSLFGGKGGDADASDGIGGTGGRSIIGGSGGNSGGETAVGGTGTSTNVPAKPTTVAPVAGGAGPRGAGGAGPGSTSTGTR